MRFLVVLLLLLLFPSDSPLNGLAVDDTWDVVRTPLTAPDRARLDGEGLNACPRPAAPLDRLLYDRTLREGASLSCGNRVLGLIYFPEADPTPHTAARPPSPLGGFEPLLDQIRSARREVLIANMLWDGGAASPGAAIAHTLAAMRLDVRDHPERYPDGLKVRLMLGHSIRLDALTDPTANAYTAAEQLLAAGIPLTGDPVAGFSLELADYGYAIPHQHVKLIVVDGQDMSAGGYNVSWFHLPSTVRSPGALQGGGQGLHDLALRVRGPVARHAAAAFWDGWTHSHALRCLQPPQPGNVRQVCQFAGQTQADPLPTAPAPAAGTANVYGLYRRSGYTDSDDTVAALFGAATQHIDVMQAQVSGTLLCSLSFASGECTFPGQQLEVWKAAIGAVRARHVRLRLLLDYDPALHWEGVSLLSSFREALRPEGLDGLVEARWYAEPGGIHAKAALIDDRMLTVGSQNLHFSSFGPHGLAEYTLATSDPATIHEYRTGFERDWASGRPVELPWWAP